MPVLAPGRSRLVEYVTVVGLLHISQREHFRLRALVRSNVDGDADGLTDDWENFRFGSLAQSMAKSAAGDGVGNRTLDTLPTFLSFPEI